MQMEDEVKIIRQAYVQATRRGQMHDTRWVFESWWVFKESEAPNHQDLKGIE